jgi:hypothetical protein
MTTGVLLSMVTPSVGVFWVCTTDSSTGRYRVSRQQSSGFYGVFQAEIGKTM